MRRARALLWILVCLAISAPVQGQAPDKIFDQRGLDENRAYSAMLPFEHIDTASGSLVMTFTDLVLPGNAGRDLSLQRVFNTKTPENSIWTFGIAGMVMKIEDSGLNPQPSSQPNPNPPYPDPDDTGYRPRLHRADGAVVPTLWMRKPLISQPSTYRWVTTAQFWRYDRVEKRLYFPDGTVATFDESATSRPNLRLLSEIRDKFNNVVELDWDAEARLTTIRQYLSATQVRTVTYQYDGSMKNPSSMSVDDRTNGTWQYAYDGSPFEILTSVTPPVGPAWTYGWDTTGPWVTTPQGGHVAYEMGTHTFIEPTDPVPTHHTTSVVVARSTSGTLPAGTWTYGYVGQVTTVSGPDNVVTEYTHREIPENDFSSRELALGGGQGLVLRVVKQSNVELEREQIDYRSVSIVEDFGGGGSAISRRRIWRNGQLFDTAYDYGAQGSRFWNYHRPVKITEIGTKRRETKYTYTYNLHPDILGKLEKTEVSEDFTNTALPIFARSSTYDWGTGFRSTDNTFGVVTTFEPSPAGNVARVTDANNHAVAYSYDWGRPSARDTMHVDTTRVISSAGAITSQTEGGRTTSYSYDALGRPTSETVPGTLPTTTTYDPVGRWVTNEQGNSQIGVAWTRADIDGAGRTLHTTDAVGNERATQYDAYGRVSRQSTPYDSTHPIKWAEIEYDGLGRVKKRTHPDNDFASFAYNALTVVITDEKGRTTTQHYDAFGDPGETRLASVVDADGKTWSYSYDILGNLRRIVAPEGSPATDRRWDYNTKNRLTKEVHPESGATEYEYDDAGNMTAKIDATGRRIDFSYDENDRLKRLKSGTEQHDITYEPGSNLRRTVSTNQVDSFFEYDDGGRLKHRRDNIAGEIFHTYQDYDDRGNIDELTYPDGRLIKYRYDTADRINRIEDLSNGTVTYASAFRYHPSGALEEYTAGNGVVTTIGYDPERLWTSTINVALPTPVTHGLALSYGYDKVGNVKDLNEPGRPGNFNQTLTYDNLDRLKTATGTYGGQSFDYDAHGNQLMPGHRDYDFDTLRLTSDHGVTFGYDNAGRMTSRQNDSFAYDMKGMMTSATVAGRTTTYGYDGDDVRKLRVEQVSGVEERSYFVHGLGSSLLSEAVKRGTGPVVPTRDYIYAGTRLIAVAKPRVLPRIEWASAGQRVQEAVGTVAPKLVLRKPASGIFTGDIIVNWSTANGQARAGRDYTQTSGSVTIPASAANGAEFALPGIQITSDALDEDDEGFIVRIDSVTGSPAILGAQREHTITIEDDDLPPVVHITVDPQVGATVGETVKAVLHVSLSAPSGKTITVFTQAVASRAAACGYFLPYEGPLTFREDEPTSQRIEVTPVNNLRGSELAKAFTVQLSNPVNVTLGTAQAQITITDDEGVIAPLSLPGKALAAARGTGRDYVAITNPYASTIQAIVTQVFDDGSRWRQPITLGPLQRTTLDMGHAETVCEPGVSVLVQVQSGPGHPGVEHAGYMGNEGGVASEARLPSTGVRFAEGHTGFAKELLAIFNPTTVAANVLVNFRGVDGVVLSSVTRILPPLGRYVWHLNPLMNWAEHSITIGVSNTDSGVVATRTMLADSQWVWSGSHDGHESTGAGLPDTGTSAFLAEGHHGGALKTYLAVKTGSDIATTATITYLHENGTAYPTSVVVPAGGGRVTVEPPPSLPAGGFGYQITTNPSVLFVAERMMYTVPNLSAGHVAMAVPAPSGVRGFSEGATGPFETFFLVANPSSTEATVLLEFYSEAGALLQRHNLTVPATSRRAVSVNNLPSMSAQIFHTLVFSSVPVVTERVSYWPSRAAMTTLGLLAVPFSPGASQLFAPPKPWTPPSDGSTAVTPPYTLTPSTLIGPAWEPAALAAAASQLGGGDPIMTALASGTDAWLAAHASGGWEVSATSQLVTASLETATATVTEGGALAVNVRVSVASGTTLPSDVKVMYATAAASAAFPATAGADYTAQTGEILFPAGWSTSQAKTITVATVQDTTHEYPEPFVLTLTGVEGRATVGSQSGQTITILDNDPQPSMAVNDVTVNETTAEAVFNITLSAATQTYTAATARTAPGTAFAGLDYEHREIHATFAPGQTLVQLRVPILNDEVSEPSETFFVDLTDPINGTISRARGTGTILDNEPARVPINTAMNGQFFADVRTTPTSSAYIMISNPHAVPVTARLTFTKPNASGVTRDLVVPANRRVTVDLGVEPGIAHIGDVSVAVQTTNSAYPLVSEISQYWDAEWRGGRNTRGANPASQFYYAEGSASAFFDEYLTIYNLMSEPVDIVMTILPEGLGTPQTRTYRINEGPGRLKLRMSTLLGDLSHGTIIQAFRLNNQGVGQIATERTTYWSATDQREGASATGSSAQLLEFYFPEGAKGMFTTHLMLANATASDATVEVRYYHDNGDPVVVQAATIPAMRRITLQPPAAVGGGGFAFKVTSTNNVPFVAERAIYGNVNGDIWKMGSAETGARFQGLRWQFAEGASTGTFTTYLLLFNPNNTAATGTMTFRLENGNIVTAPVTVPANRRVSFDLANITGLAGQTYAIDVAMTNGVQITAERVMYWPQPWGASHSSTGKPW